MKRTGKVKGIFIGSIKVVLPLLILIAGYAGMRMLEQLHKPPEKKVKVNPGVLVEVMGVKKKDYKVTVVGTGTVQPKKEANIIPQVSGRIVYLAPGFVAGGFFKKGELLFRIESTDYELAIEQAKASLAKAEYDLATVESKARVARAEWKRLRLKDIERPNPLVFYKPQLKNAKASVESAKAGLKKAVLDLERTRIYSPFNLRIRSEEIEAGQYVRAGESVARVAGTDTAEIILPLPVDELRWISVPKHGLRGEGSMATIRVSRGGKAFTWEGRVTRSLGEIDLKSRMARIVVDVKDPYQLKRRVAGRPDLEVGAFVEVSVEGSIIRGVAPIPGMALRENSTVWVMDDKSRLRIKPVKVVRREKDIILVGEGLDEGERIVLTTIIGAVDGMKLRVSDKRKGI